MKIKLALVCLIYRIQELFNPSEKLFHLLQIGKKDKVLEVGCACGHHTLPLLRLASEGRIYAVDVWKDGLDYLKRQTETAQNLEIFSAGAEAVNFPALSLDKVICLNTLHDLTDWPDMLKKWRSLLKIGGRFFYKDPVIELKGVTTNLGDAMKYVGVIKGVHIFERTSDP